MRLVLFTAAAAALCVANSVAFAGAANSVGYQIDAAHDGYAAFKKGFKVPLKQAWSVNLGGPVSYPVVANGLVFVTVGNTQSYGSQFFALDLKTGATVWQKAISGTYYWSNVAYDKGQLFLINFNGELQAYSADSTGTLAWIEQLPNQYDFEPPPPTASEGQLFLTGAGEGVTLYAVNETTGAVNWTQEGPAGWSSPAVGDNGVYVTYPCNYYKYDRNNGSLVWSVQTGCDGGGGGNPSYFDKSVYVQDSASGDRILNAHTGQQIGTFVGTWPAAFWKSGSNNDLGFVVNNGGLEAFAVSTNNVTWTFGGDGGLNGSPIVINDSVVIGSSSGMLYVLDAQSGTESWSINVGSPIGASNGPTTGLGVGGGMLLVPAGYQLSAWKPK